MSVRVVRVGGPNTTQVVPVGNPGGGAIPVPVGSGRPALGQLRDVDTTGAPVDTPITLRLGTDGVYRLEPAPTSGTPAWGDPVRFAEGPPADEAPLGAVHVDVTTHRIYQQRSTP